VLLKSLPSLPKMQVQFLFLPFTKNVITPLSSELVLEYANVPFPVSFFSIVLTFLTFPSNGDGMKPKGESGCDEEAAPNIPRAVVNRELDDVCRSPAAMARL